MFKNTSHKHETKHLWTPTHRLQEGTLATTERGSQQHIERHFSRLVSHAMYNWCWWLSITTWINVTCKVSTWMLTYYRRKGLFALQSRCLHSCIRVQQIWIICVTNSICNWNLEVEHFQRTWSLQLTVIILHNYYHIFPLYCIKHNWIKWCAAFVLHKV